MHPESSGCPINWVETRNDALKENCGMSWFGLFIADNEHIYYIKTFR